MKLSSLLSTTMIITLLAGCSAHEAHEIKFPSTPPELGDCKFFEFKTPNGEKMVVTRCPNSNTSTQDVRNKSIITNTLIDEKKSENSTENKNLDIKKIEADEKSTSMAAHPNSTPAPEPIDAQHSLKSIDNPNTTPKETVANPNLMASGNKNLIIDKNKIKENKTKNPSNKDVVISFTIKNVETQKIPELISSIIQRTPTASQ